MLESVVSVTSLLSTPLVFLCTWIAYKIFVLPLLSPLRKIPGTTFNPFFGDMTRISKGEAMEASLGLIKEFGPLYRYYYMFGRERLAVADPAIMKQITSSNADNYMKPPSRVWFLKSILGSGLIFSEGAQHAAQKRLISPAFNHVSITNMLPKFQKRVESLSLYWQKTVENDKTGEVPVQTDLARETLDVIGDTAFGYDLNTLWNPDSPVAIAFNNIVGGAGLTWKSFLPFYHKLPTEFGRAYRSNLKTIRSTVESVIEEKRKLLQSFSDTSSLDDCLSIILKAEDGINKVTTVELRDQVLTLMSAGHESTATTMTWMLWVFVIHSEIQQKCREEILGIFSEETEITWERLEALSYCNNVIKETLRMYPPFPLLLREAKNDDIFLEKYFIPKGTITVLLIGPMMRRPEIFEDPETFNPDRFNSPEINQKLFSFMPFLMGPRMCLGHKFAMAELTTMMVILLKNFEFGKIADYECKRRLRITMRPDPPLRLKVTKRI